MGGGSQRCRARLAPMVVAIGRAGAEAGQSRLAAANNSPLESEHGLHDAVGTTEHDRARQAHLYTVHS